MARLVARLMVAASSLLALGSCEANRMNTAVGRHVIIHWSPDEHTMCGGTLEYVDASLEIVAGTYEVSLPDRPAIEIYWEREGSLASGLCASRAGGCTAPFPNGTSFMVSTTVTHAHELTHTVRLSGDSHGMPAFFGEGIAVRWEREPSEPIWWRSTDLEARDPDDLRALLDQPRLDYQAYSYAGFFWAWLEAEYGGPILARFAARLGRFSPADKIELEFHSVFGVPIIDAIEAFESQPPLALDIHACAMDQLPRLTWRDQPLMLSEGPSRCDSTEIINVATTMLEEVHGAARLSHLQLPDAPRQYLATVTGPANGLVFLEPCVGHARPHEDAIILSPEDSPMTLSLSGNYMVTAVGPLAADGTVELVEARLEAP